MQPEDRVRILHMIEATEAALGFVAGRQRADLDDDTMLRFALVRAIEVLAGEMLAGGPPALPRRSAQHPMEPDRRDAQPPDPRLLRDRS